jgi:hypothetical protein
MSEFSAALWLVQISVVASGLILLTLLLARFTRQPARRQRLCEAGLAAALLATAVSLAPAWVVIGLPIKTQESAPADSGPPPVEILDLRLDPGVLVPDHPLADVPGANLPREETQPLAADPPRFSLGAAIALTLLSMYGAGMLFFLVRWLGGVLVLRRLLKHTEPVPAPVLEMLGITSEHGPRLLVSRKLRVPISCGVWKPTVVLPIDFCQSGAAARLRWVLAHELTHIERNDALSAVLFALGQVVFFHLPWFWMLRKQVRLCQEYVADAAAVAERPADEYAEFLLTLTENKALPLLTTGVGGPVSDLFRRVTMLLQNPLRVEKRCPRLWSWGLTSGLLALAALLGGVGLRAAAADTIIIIIPGKTTAEPGKDKTTGALHVIRFVDQGTIENAPRDHILRFTEEARKAGVVFKLDDKGNITPADPLLDPAIRARFTLKRDESVAKNPAPVKENLDQLANQLLQLLEQLQKSRPDVKELPDLIKRLKAMKGAATKERLGVLPKDAVNAYKPAPVLQLPVRENKPAQADPLIQWLQAPPQKGQIDMKKLEKLLEQIQKAPDKIDPKEISKMLQEIRKAMEVSPNMPYDQLIRYYARLNLPSTAHGRFGLRFSPPSSDLREHLGLPKDQGLVIEEVFAGTPAAKAGLKVKDIVLKLNDQPISSDTNRAAKMFADVKDGASVSLTILRRGREEIIKGIKPAPSAAANYFRYKVTEGKGLPITNFETLPEKGALVTIRAEGGALIVQQREKQLTITIKGALKDGKATNLEVLIEVEGKEAFRGGPAAVPEAWRQRVQRLLELTRAWQAGPQSRAPEPRFRDPAPNIAEPNRPNPPAVSLKGKVEKIDARDGLVEISIGADQGLKKNNTLEVYRLSPKAEYLGMLRVVEVSQHKAVGRMIRNTFANRSHVQQGDEVASSLDQP